MDEKKIEDLKEKILNFLAKYPTEQFKPKVLARRLSIKGDEEYRSFQRILNELHQVNAILRGKGKRYCRATPPTSHKLTGILSITKSRNGMVSLLPPNTGTVTISSRFLSTALDGDIVNVALFAHHKYDKNKVITEQHMDGEIIEVVQRSKRPVVGVLEKSKNFFFMIPDDRKIGRDIYIPRGKTGGAKPGEKIVVQIESWESNALNPEGSVIERLGKAGDVSSEMAAVVREFQLPLDFSHDVRSEIESINEKIPKEEFKNRLDLRQLICFTIDPEDAKDFDDAVSIEIEDKGHYKIGVHIADVSHYVREDTALDKEALKRGTSVYLADNVIPMLPEKLSNNVCSLCPNEDRLTYSVFIDVSSRGTVKKYTIEKSFINSKRRFNYEEVQKIIEGKQDSFAEPIRAMHRLSQLLLKKRLKEGSIDFESVETKFRYDKEGKPSEIVKKPRLDSHRLIEEFMLLANQVVAKHIGLIKKHDNISPFIYRVHDAPPPEKLADLASFVQHLGYSLDVSTTMTSSALQKLLSDVKGKEEENVINEVAIRSMAKAFYSEKNMGHFGLGFKYYTHFTSPIRRYPDLVVHRLLNEYTTKITRNRLEQLQQKIPYISQQSSERERIALEAERASVKVMQVEYMKRHLGDTFNAIISGVTNFGMFVEITDLLVEGLIRVRDMKDDYYVFDEKRYSLAGRRTKKRYRLGDKVKIQVIRVDPEEREIDFILIE